MNCNKAQDLYSSYIENALDLKSRVDFERHLETCEGCRADYERFKAAIILLDEVPEVEPPANFHASVMSRIEESRRSAPKRVEWWKIDWSKVFVVRVPARAVAMGFAVLLAFVMIYQLTPASTITAGWLWPQKSQQKAIGFDDESAPRVNANRCGAHNTGLDIRIENAGDAEYDVQLSTRLAKSVRFRVDSMPAVVNKDFDAFSAKLDRIYSGAVDKVRGEVLVRLRDEKAVRIAWDADGCSYNEVVFLPSRFDAKASGKKLTAEFSKTSLYNVLSGLSEEYGIVILASGDLSRPVGFTGIYKGTPEEAIFNASVKTGMRWTALGASVYKVEPGE